MASNPTTNAPIPFPQKQPQQPPSPMQNELRDRWVNKYPDTVFARGDFYRYKDGIWKPLSKYIQQREVEDILINASKNEKVRVTANLVSNISQLSMNKCAISDDLFDRNTSYIVCKNGALHIPTLKLRPHDIRLFATVREEYDYDPAATCPMWIKLIDYLRDVLSQQSVDWLQEFVGLCATTDMRFDVACWLYGKPGGGKSSFITGVNAALSNRTMQLGLADLVRPFALSNLPGKTLAIATEQPADYIKSTQLLNRLISGDRVRIEQKYKDSFDFDPTIKVLWAMNELPRLQSPNDGILRRANIFVLPPIAAKDRDPSIRENIKTEGPGILNWALLGLQRLYTRGHFVTPAEVAQAVQDYKENNDIPLMFLQDEYPTYNTDTSFKISSTDLYNRYKQWCAETGHRPKSLPLIARDWVRLEMKSKRGSSGVEWFGPMYVP